MNTKARCFFIGRVDNYAYLPEAVRADDWLEMTSVFRNSELGTPVNKGVEMLNYAPHPVVEDVRLLPGGMPLPILAASLEYDRALPEAAQQAFRKGIECIRAFGKNEDWHGVLPSQSSFFPNALRHYPQVSYPGSDGLVEFIETFVRTICADRQLPVIYPRHQEADEAYLRRILG